MSDDFTFEVSEKADEIAYNYLVRNGIPSTPGEVAKLVQGVFTSGIAWSVATGSATLTEAVTADPAQQAKVRAAIKREEALLDRLNAEVTQRLASLGSDEQVGAYL